MPRRQPALSVGSLTAWGSDLHRPECVVATAAGDVFVPDWRGGVTVIRADGSQRTWLAREAGIELRPNALAFHPDGSFLLANLADPGGIWKLTIDGDLIPFLTEVDGVPLPPTNFVTVGRDGRIWISVSTRARPRQLAWRPDVADGFVVVFDSHGARIAADGLHYTNEVRPDPSGESLYVVETFGRSLTRFRIMGGGALSGKVTVARLGYGGFPDGFAFDERGGLWMTSLVSNRLLRVAPDGAVTTVLEDSIPDYVEEVERAFAAGEMEARHLGPIPGARLQQLTSIAFGGPDRRTAFLGSLHAPCVYRFLAPDPGAPPDHAHLDPP